MMEVIRKYIVETNHDIFLGNKNYTTETYQYIFEDDSNSILYEADVEHTDPSFRWVLYLLPLGNELKETFFRMKMKIRIQNGLFLVHMTSIHFDVEMTVTVNPDIIDIDNIDNYGNSSIQDVNIHKMDLFSGNSMYSYSFIKNRVKSQIKSFVCRDFHHFIQHIQKWVKHEPETQQ